MKFPERMVWIVAVVSILAWSIISRPETDGGGSAEATKESPPTPGSRDRSFADSNQTSRQRSGRESSDRSNIGSRTLGALRSGDPLSRLSGFLRILETAEAGNIDQVSTALSELKSAGISLAVEEDLMHYRQGQLKGGELMAGRVGSSEDFAMIGVLKKQYEGWVQAESHAAGRWLEGLPSGKYRDQMAVAYIAACAKDDPVGSLGLVSSLHPSQQSAAGKAAAQRLAESTSADEASALFQTLESNAGSANSPYLSTLFDTLVSGAGREDERLAVSLVESHLDQSFVKGSTLARVSAERAKTDPEGALAWAISMEGKKTDLRHGDIVASAIRGMTVDGLEHAKQWAATQQDGAPYWLDLIERREEQLNDRVGEENEYDKDD